MGNKTLKLKIEGLDKLSSRIDEAKELIQKLETVLEGIADVELTIKVTEMRTVIAEPTVSVEKIISAQEELDSIRKSVKLD